MEHNPVTQFEPKQAKLAPLVLLSSKDSSSSDLGISPPSGMDQSLLLPHPLAPSLLFFCCMFIPHPRNIFLGLLYSQEYFFNKEKILNVYQCKGLELTSDKPGFGLPRWLSVKESACQTGDTGLIPEDPLEKEMATHSSTLFFFLIFY